MIILKNEVKALFKEFKMPEGLTVNRVGKFIVVTGQCGEPILTITKVEVGAKLTKIERELLISDYLRPAITEYRDAILAYVKLKKDTSNADAISKIHEDHNVSVGNNSHRYGVNKDELPIYDYYCYSPKDNNSIIISLRTKTNIFEVSVSSVNEDEYKAPLKAALKTAKEVLPKLKELYATRDIRTLELQKTNELLNESCGF